MSRLVNAKTLALFAVLTLYVTGLAQDPCSEIGTDCRSMTVAEVRAFKERLLAVNALLPVPDPARYIHDGAAEASTMPFIAGQSIPQAALICRSWPAGCFPEEPYNTLLYGYRLKVKEDKAAAKPKNVIDATLAMMSEFENRVEIAVWLRPHPVMMYEGIISDAVNVEKSATFLSWQSGEENIEQHMIFGPRTENEEETLMLEKPAKTFAPVKSIEIIISGPEAEVALLAKKLDRKAMEVLLGPVVE